MVTVISPIHKGMAKSTTIPLSKNGGIVVDFILNPMLMVYNKT